MRKKILFFICAAVFTTNAQGLRLVQPVGVGSRATALANTHVALSTDIADLYYNPAAFAFSVSREFQASLIGLRLSSSSLFFRTETDDDIQRFKTGSIGFTYAVPATQGGFTFAASYSNPLQFDDISNFSGSYQIQDTTVTIDKSIFRTTGGLNLWSAGFGLQVAPKFGVGLAAALVTGREYSDDQMTMHTQWGAHDTADAFHDKIFGRYLGYDIRAGVQYKGDIVTAGARLVLPQMVRLKERFNEAPPQYDDGYTMYSSYAGAAGLSFLLPFVTITTEARITLPFDFVFPVENIPQNSQAGFYKMGGGIGCEIPLVIAPLMVRAGYAFDELDLHPYVYKLDHTTYFDWSDNGTVVTKNRHQGSIGLGYTTPSMSFDCSYNFSTWGILSNTYLDQTYLQHRVLISVAMRY